MSSIKRDVKKKLLPRPEGERIVSISSPLSMRVSPDSLRGFALEGLPFLWFSLPVAPTPIGSERLRKRE